ncbi:MAG TPA: YdcF family protein [Stellaceae bacterium]|nr:YdcF family protein [Bauldia sp.]HWB49866.1 YdcF family protein [Stellaceae bacterium]
MTHVLRHPAAPSHSSADGAPPPAIGGIRVALALIAAAAVVAVVVGFIAFATTIANARPPVSPEAEGIVVLTGGSARIDGALRLLAEHRAGRLLISGVNPAVGPAAIADTVEPDLNGIMACCVDLGHAARDTIGNATETRDWAAEHDYRSLIVVTSDYHMPRSLAELADAMPGVELIPYPVSNPELHLDTWWRDTDAFGLLVREYGKYLLTASRLALSPLAPPPAAGLAGNAGRPTA